MFRSIAIIAGAHAVEWDGRSDLGTRMTSGIYLYVIRVGAARASGKVLLIH